MQFAYTILVVAVLVILSVLASKASVRVGIPALLLFLLIGMLAGSEGIGGIEFDNPAGVQALGTVALALILFAAGFETRWSDVRPVLLPGISLSTLGVLVSAVAVALFAQYAFELTFTEGLLLGGIISSTDAAAVFSVLRSRGLHLENRVRRLLEFESGSNDPMAVMLTLGVIEALQHPGTGWTIFAAQLLLQLVVGAGLGFLLGRATVQLLNRVRLEWEGLYPVLSLAMVLAVYGGSTLAGGNGFLAVYAAGLVLGNRTFIHRKSLRQFHDGLAWLSQITMFLVLGLQVFPSELLTVAVSGLLLSGFLMVVARPLSVLLAVPAGFTLPQKLFLSWTGLRGAVPIVLATFALTAGIKDAGLLFNLVFFVSITSALVQGSTIHRAAGLMKVKLASPPRRVFPVESGALSGTESEITEFRVEPGSAGDGKRIVDLALPSGALIVLVGRDAHFAVPGGSTIVRAGDTVMALGTEEALAEIRRKLESPAT